jgi:putative ABC transport system permease protein
VVIRDRHGAGRGHPTLRTKLTRDIRRQWAPFAAVTLTVTLGVALFAASYDAYGNLRDSYANVFAVERFADLWVDGTGPRSAGAADALAAVEGVRATAVRTQADLPIRVGPDKLRGRVVGIPVGAQPTVDRVTVLEGRYPAASGQVAVEHHLAGHFGLHPGSRVDILGVRGWRTVSVSAVVSSAEYLWPARSRQEPITTAEDFGVVFAPQGLVDALAPDAAPQVQVLLTDVARGTGLLATVRSQARELGATTTTSRAEQPSNSLLQEDINGFSQLSFLFPLLFLTASGMATYVLLTRRVDAEREVIGMLLASGVSRRTVLSHYLGYGLAAGAAGAVLGVVIGEALARLVSRFYLQAIDLPASLGVLTVARPGTVALGLSFGLGAAALSALLPALGAAHLPPAEAMRGLQPPTRAGRSLAEKLIPPLRRAPTTVRLVLRGVGRNRRRTAFTATGVVMSLLVVLTSWTMIDTMSALLSVQFDQVSRQDARVDLATPAGSAALDRIAAVPGVAEAEPLAQIPVTLESARGSYATALVAMPAGTDLHGFRLVGGGTTSLGSVPGGSILVGRAVQDLLGTGTSDTVTLVGPAGTRTSARIAGLLDEPLGTYAYAPLSAVDTLVGPVPAQSALLRLEHGADRDAVRRAVTALPDVAAYEDSQSLKQAFDRYTGLFYGFIGAMLALGAVMAFAIIFTTMSVTIVERSREVATLRTAGVRRRAIATLVAGENLLVTLLGVVPGLAVGVLGGRAFLSSYSNDQFRLDLVVRPLTLVVSALALLVVAGFSQWPGLRAVTRLDLARAVRERSG